PWMLYALGVHVMGRSTTSLAALAGTNADSTRRRQAHEARREGCRGKACTALTREARRGFGARVQPGRVCNF
ncbi:unnamed protein product, partial [Rhizoctonia solani]